MSGLESFDLHVQQWRCRRGRGEEIEKIGDSSFDPDGVLNTPELVSNPAVGLDAMDVSEPDRIDATETPRSASSPPRSATLLLQKVTKVSMGPVKTGGDANVEVDPSLQNVTAPCAAAWRRTEMMDLIVA
jgi:hypothetical protein